MTGRPQIGVLGRAARPSPPSLEKAASFPSYPQTDGALPFDPVLSDPGWTGRLISLLATKSSHWAQSVTMLWIQ